MKRDQVAAWVRKLNRLAREAEEMAAWTHPSVWKDDPAVLEWKALARRGPR